MPMPGTHAGARLRIARLVAALLGALPLLAVVSVQVASAVTCDPSTPTPSTSDPGTTILADNFESGSFGQWSTVVAWGDATAYVSNAHHVDGWCGGKLHVTTNTGSTAYIRKSIGWYSSDVWASGSFYVDIPGVSGNNVPFFRFWKDSQRMVDIFRANSDGQFWLRIANGSGGWTYVKLNRWVSLDRWYQVKLHVHPNWSSSGIEIWLDGSKIYSNWAAYVPTATLNAVMVGAEHQRQMMGLYFDAVVIKAT